MALTARMSAGGIQQLEGVLERQDVAGEHFLGDHGGVGGVGRGDVLLEHERWLGEVRGKGQLQRLITLAVHRGAEANDGALRNVGQAGQLGDGQVHHLPGLLEHELRHPPHGRVERIHGHPDAADMPSGTGRKRISAI